MPRHLPLALLILVAGCATHRPAPPRGPGGEGGPAGGSRALLFISPMGEPFRAAHTPERLWFDGADIDHDDRLPPAEFNADALRFFAVLDQGQDGEIDPDDIERYENILAPEIRTGGGGGGNPRGSGRGRRGGRGGPPPGGGGPSGGGGGRAGSFQFGGDRKQARYADQRQGATRFGYINLPEPVVAADRNMNRGIDRNEMLAAAAQRFALLDTNHDGAIARGELPRLTPTPGGGGRRPPMRQGRPAGDGGPGNDAAGAADQ